jgi:hypothetical protein
VDGRPETLLGNYDVIEFIRIVYCVVDVIFASNKVDFLTSNGDLDRFSTGHVSTSALDIFGDDLERSVFCSGENIGTHSLEGIANSVKRCIVGVS